MFKVLNQEEMKEFVKNYLPIWLGDIVKVSLIEYDGIKEYLVNDHYLITIKNQEVIKKEDFQELLYK